jgi:hypothetical protein
VLAVLAASAGHLGILQHLCVQKRLHLSPEIAAAAAEHGHVLVLVWLREQGCYVDFFWSARAPLQ